MGIMIFEKNKIDLDQPNITLTATDGTIGADAGTSFIDFLRNRKNDSGWGTGGSSDAGNTTIIVTSTDQITADNIFLVGMNFKAYTIQYDAGAGYVDFSTPINVAGNATTTKRHTFNQVTFNAIKLIITGTMVADEDKYMAQLIITNLVGAFTAQPHVKKIVNDKGRKVRKMLSGKANVTRATGGFSCQMTFPAMKSAADFTIIQSMYSSFNGFLVWLCGGDTSNFFTDIEGWRLQDIYLMSCTNELDTEWNKGFFHAGQEIDINLMESRI